MKRLQQILKEHPNAYKINVEDCILVFFDGKEAYEKAVKNNQFMFFSGQNSIFDINGNPLYRNFSSSADALQEIDSLKARGVNAKIGPVAPNAFGVSLKQKHPDWVGVYLLEQD